MSNASWLTKLVIFDNFRHFKTHKRITHEKILPAAVFAILLAACSQQTQDSASQAASSVAEDTKANATVVAQEAEAAAQATGNAVENAAETASNAAKTLVPPLTK